MYQRSPELRFTPGLATALVFTAILALWITADVANAAMQPTVLSNALEIATGASWLYFFSGRRRERELRASSDQDVAATISQLRSR